MAKKFPIHPEHPERICWGCDQYCPVDSLNCGNGSERTPHPFELFGENWLDWGSDYAAEPAETADRGAYSTDELFWLAAMPALTGPTLRIFRCGVGP